MSALVIVSLIGAGVSMLPPLAEVFQGFVSNIFKLACLPAYLEGVKHALIGAAGVAFLFYLLRSDK